MSAKKIKKPLPEQAYNIAQSHFGDILEKSGFDAYQSFRAFFAEILTTPGAAKSFSSNNSVYHLMGDFQLLDQAYIDNLTLCLTIKLKTPDVYDEMVTIIDRHIRPEPRNAGFNHLYQECGGFLVFLLTHYEGISVRQALHAAAQFTGYSESTIEKSYRTRMKALSNKLGKDALPPPLVLAALYWTLYKKEAKPSDLTPFGRKNTRSTDETRKTVAAYWSLTAKITAYYQDKILRYCQKHPLNIISAFAKENGLSFPLPKDEIQKPKAFAVFYVLSAALIIDTMPDFLQELDAKAKQIS